MLVKFLFKLPSYDFFPLTVKINPGMKGLHLKECLELSLCKFGQSALQTDRMRLIFQGSELPDEASLLSAGFLADQEALVDVVVKVVGVSIRAPRLFEYREFVRQVLPEDGARDVPLDTLIRLRFGSNSTGYALSLAYFRDSSATWTCPDRLFGDMVAQLGGDVAEARSRGFVQWSKKKYSQRVFLLQVDPAAAPLLFPEKKPPKAKSRTRRRSSAAAAADPTPTPANSTIGNTNSRYLDSRRYWHAGSNEGYIGGDAHSWQRYTFCPPLDVSITESSWPIEGFTGTAFSTAPLTIEPVSSAERCAELPLCTHTFASFTIADETTLTRTLTLKPAEPLKPQTVYTVLLMNSVPTFPAADCEAGWAAFASAGMVAEDMLFSFTTAPA